jgi:nucleotide-binding universal stress UspA family protein
MKSYKILVPTDFSDTARCALAHAINLARKFDGEIHLLHVAEIPTPAIPDLPLDIIDIVEEKGIADLDELVNSFDMDLPEITRVVRAGIPSKPPADVILEYAKDLDADVLVIGTHGRRGARRFLLGSVTEEVVRRAMCPVLTIRKQKKAYLMPSVQRILVPVDFSDASKKLVDLAAELAQKLHARITLMHVVDIEFYPYYGLTEDPVRLIERNMIDVSMNKLNEMVESLRDRGVKANWETDTGHTVRVINEYAERNEIDLILVGTHGRSGFDRLMLGSIAEKILRSAFCPVMIMNTSKVESEKEVESVARFQEPTAV